MTDTIERQVAIDEVDSETVSTNPEHFKSSEKFIKFMNDADIASFGKWQWANGFNTALVAIKVLLKKLPSAQPERKRGKWIIVDDCELFIAKCSECGRIEDSRMIYRYPYCHCGADMRGEYEE